MCGRRLVLIDLCDNGWSNSATEINIYSNRISISILLDILVLFTSKSIIHIVKLSNFRQGDDLSNLYRFLENIFDFYQKINKE
ncbi:hypothetical protein XIS1_1260030 [Xenorhabdus innexi]|uniref:Uncharacterized protein n=1 Tax=Xenorhabdus innexi TaxID=290109 RepID=A0A1N6MSR5_9GAMM|nr:hypothetical protein XIS1_1260030 [Xenorhabdus innexi]